DIATAETINTDESTYKDGSPIGESAHEDATPGEPTWEEDTSPLPVEKSAHEDATPLPVEETLYQEEDFPVDETAIPEDVHQVEHPFTEVYLSAVEALPNEGSIGAVQAHLVQVSTRDLALYKGWGKLTSAIKASRAQKLAVKGLPTPNEDGFVSILVTGAGAQSMT
ncbi:hypothetical protein ZTR_09811, partial [Talaromyces verruculosus]